MNTTRPEIPTASKVKVPWNWIVLVVTLVICITSLFMLPWAKNQGWQYYTRKNSGLESDYYRPLAIDDLGQVWIGTSKGLIALTPDGQWKIYLADENVDGLVIDTSGRMWVRTYGGRLIVIAPDGVWTRYTETNSGLAQDKVFSLAIGAHGQVWVGTIKGLNIVTPDGIWTKYTTDNSGLAGDAIFSLAIDNQGGVWAGTNKGLSVLTPDGQWTNYNETNSSLRSDSVNVLAIDRQGRVWASDLSSDGGLSVFTPDGHWTRYTASNSGLISDRVLSLAADAQGRVWVDTDVGLSILTPDGNWTKYDKFNSVLANRRLFFVDLQGRAWVSTPEGIASFDQSASVTPDVVQKILVLANISLAALIVQIFINIVFFLEKKRLLKLASVGEGGIYESLQEQPVGVRLRIWVRFASGFLGCYLFQGAWLLLVDYISMDIYQETALYVCLIPFSMIPLIIFAIKPRSRPIAFGILAALAVNTAISLVLGLLSNAIFLAPFFYPLD